MRARMRDGSGSRHYRYIVEDTDRHGNVRLYFRRKGEPKVRLRETPGTTSFDQEYARAYRNEVRRASGLKRPGPATAGTLRWLCEQYYGSAAFRALAISTRKVRRGILDSICARAGMFRSRLWKRGT